MWTYCFGLVLFLFRRASRAFSYSFNSPHMQNTYLRTGESDDEGYLEDGIRHYESSSESEPDEGLSYAAPNTMERLAWGRFAMKNSAQHQVSSLQNVPDDVFHSETMGPIHAPHIRTGFEYAPRSANLPPHLARIHTQLSPIPSKPGSPVADMLLMHRTFGTPSPVPESPASSRNLSPQPLSPLIPNSSHTQGHLPHYGSNEPMEQSPRSRVFMWPVSPQSFDVDAPQPRHSPPRKKSLGARLAKRVSIRMKRTLPRKQNLHTQPSDVYISGTQLQPPRRKRRSFIETLGLGSGTGRRSSIFRGGNKASTRQPQSKSRATTMGRTRKPNKNQGSHALHTRKAAAAAGGNMRFSSRSKSLAPVTGVNDHDVYCRASSARTPAGRTRLFLNSRRGSSLERDVEIRRDREATAGLLAESDTDSDSTSAEEFPRTSNRNQWPEHLSKWVSFHVFISRSAALDRETEIQLESLLDTGRFSSCLNSCHWFRQSLYLRLLNHHCNLWYKLCVAFTWKCVIFDILSQCLHTSWF